MEIKINKLSNDENYPIYYLNIHCIINKNELSEIKINYKSSFNHFIEKTNEKIYFIADKIESTKETVINLINKKTLKLEDIQKNIEGRFIVLNIKNNLLSIYSDKLGGLGCFIQRARMHIHLQHT